MKVKLFDFFFKEIFVCSFPIWLKFIHDLTNFLSTPQMSMSAFPRAHVRTVQNVPIHAETINARAAVLSRERTVMWVRKSLICDLYSNFYLIITHRIHRFFTLKNVVPFTILVISPQPKALNSVVSNLDHCFVILHYSIIVLLGYLNFFLCFYFFLRYTSAHSHSLLMLNDANIVL